MPKYETIKEYLVGLGFKVDDRQYKSAMGALSKFHGLILKLGTNPLTGIAALVGVFNGIMKAAGDADMQTEKFARRMWMTESNARGLTNALEAMGESIDTINDVAISPELRGHFFQLRADAAKYENADIDASMKRIRDFQFEFQRFKLLMTNATRYIAYYLEQYLSKPMARFRAILKNINDHGSELLNKWGKRIGKFAQVVVDLGGSAIRAASDVIESLGRLPGKVKVIAGAIGAVGAVLLAPWLLVSAAILAVLLLIDDYYGWKDGKESAFGAMWEEIEPLKKKIIELGETFTDFGENIIQKVNEKLDTMCNFFRTIREFIDGILDADMIPGLNRILSMLGFDVDTDEERKDDETPAEYALKGFDPTNLVVAWSNYLSELFSPKGQSENTNTTASVANSGTVQMPTLANTSSYLTPNNITNATTNQNTKKVTNNFNSNPDLKQFFYIYGANNSNSVASSVATTTKNTFSGYSNKLLTLPPGFAK